MATKTSTIWTVERTDWFGGCESMGDYHSRGDAEARVQELRRSSSACDDPDDQVTFTIEEYEWEREA